MLEIVEFRYPPKEYQYGEKHYVNLQKKEDERKLFALYAKTSVDNILIKVSKNEYSVKVKKGCLAPTTLDDFEFGIIREVKVLDLE